MYVFGHKDAMVHCVGVSSTEWIWGTELRLFRLGSKCLNLQSYPADSVSPLLLGFCLLVFSNQS